MPDGSVGGKVGAKDFARAMGRGPCRGGACHKRSHRDPEDVPFYVDDMWYRSRNANAGYLMYVMYCIIRTCFPGAWQADNRGDQYGRCREGAGDVLGDACSAESGSVVASSRDCGRISAFSEKVNEASNQTYAGLSARKWPSQLQRATAEHGYAGIQPV